jgi:hypothetical protein
MKKFFEFLISFHLHSEIVSRNKFSNLARTHRKKARMSLSFNGRRDINCWPIRESHEKRDYRREIKHESSVSAEKR